MIDVSSIIIEMQRLLKETYEHFNEKQHEEALANAVMLRAAAYELVKEMQK